MTTNPIHILYIEDNLNDFLLVQRLLAQEQQEKLFHLERTDRLAKGLERLAQGGIDLVLTDLGLPDSRGLETVSRIVAAVKETPVIVLTGTYQDGELANKSLQIGAQDYLVKDSLTSRWCQLAILHAVERKKMETLKDDFIGAVSHELRTPLTIMGLGLENLQAGILGPLSEKQGEVIERNIRNAKRLGKLIDNLLDLSRLESGRTKIEREAVDLKQLIHEVVDNFKTKETEGKGLFREDISPDLPHLKCDSDLIAQVLTNILGNAIRYAKDKIVVKAEMVKGADGSAEFIKTSVANDGPAIPPEKLSQLFEKFVQLDRKNRTSSYKGTGLGLAISKEIIERHRGKIGVESDGEKGVTFYFTLPICEDGQ